jgi:hypothetical protein
VSSRPMTSARWIEIVVSEAADRCRDAATIAPYASRSGIEPIRPG